MEGRAQANNTHRSLLPNLRGSGKNYVRLFYSHTTYIGWKFTYYKRNTEALVVVKEIRLEVNADKTKYMVMS
jgi:hypothetical protein